MASLSAKSDPEFLILLSGLKEKDQSLIGIMSDLLNCRNEHVFANALRYFGGITSSDDPRIPNLAVKHQIF